MEQTMIDEIQQRASCCRAADDAEHWSPELKQLVNRDVFDLLVEVHKLSAELSQYQRLEQEGVIRTAYDEENTPYYVEAEGCEAKHIIEILKAEAEGLLARLPCKVGDTVYYIRRPKKGKPAIHEMVVTKILCGADNQFRVIMSEPLAFGYQVNQLLRHFGKTVFHTKEEAREMVEGGKQG